MKVCVIGCGKMGAVHAENVAQHSSLILHSVVDPNLGLAQQLASRFGVVAASNAEEALKSSDVDAVIIASSSDTHATLIEQAARRGKAILCEKPIGTNMEEIQHVAQVIKETGVPFMLGFNRRFAPHVRVVKQMLDGTTGPKAFVMTVNAGQIPASHWTQDREIGGGRIVGEACHFIDLMRHLAKSATYMDAPSGDTATVQLAFADGSIGTVHYFANGSRAYPKETLEVFAAGRVLRLENYLKVTGYGWPGMKRTRAWRQDKGYNAFAAAYVAALAGKAPAPIAFDEVMEVSRIAIDLAHEGK